MDTSINYFFGKIGKRKDIIDFQRRKINTLATKKIAKDFDEFFEAFTYFYMFFEANDSNPVITIAFLSSQSAPDIRKLELLASKLSIPDYCIDIVPIIINDGLELIMKKDIINSLTYKISLPIDGLLDLDAFGLNELAFDDISDLKSVDLQFTLKGKRSKDIFTNRNILKRISKNVKKYYELKNAVHDELSATARNDDEAMINYNFLDNVFCSKVPIDIANLDFWDDEVKEQMHDKYMKVRRDLLKYVR